MSGALVRLLAAPGGPVARTLAGETGAFELSDVPTGSYRLRVERIGYRTWTSPAFRVEEGAAVTRTLRVPVEAVRLPAVRVSSCVPSPGEVAGLDRLWGEIRTALRIEAWTGDEELYRFATRERWRLLRGNSLRVLEETARRRHGVAGVPYASAPPDSLAARGYVQRRGERFVFFGPDARTLLSESFERTHCFHAEPPGRDRPGDWIGLAFEPAPGRELPDVNGVLWLDRGTAELRRMEFRYVHLPAGIEDARVGGRVNFERLGDGAWIVRSWRLRVPYLGPGSEPRQHGLIGLHRMTGWDIGRTASFPVTIKQMARDTSTVVTTSELSEIYDILEESGEVLAVGAGPARLDEGDAVTVRGVLDPGGGDGGGLSAAGCRVRALGTGYSAAVEGDGSFHLPSLPPGSIRLIAAADVRGDVDGQVTTGPASGGAVADTTEIWARAGGSYHVSVPAAACRP